MTITALNVFEVRTSETLLLNVNWFSSSTDDYLSLPEYWKLYGSNSSCSTDFYQDSYRSMNTTCFQFLTSFLALSHDVLSFQMSKKIWPQCIHVLFRSLFWSQKLLSFTRNHQSFRRERGRQKDQIRGSQFSRWLWSPSYVRYSISCGIHLL